MAAPLLCKVVLQTRYDCEEVQKNLVWSILTRWVEAIAPSGLEPMSTGVLGIARLSRHSRVLKQLPVD